MRNPSSMSVRRNLLLSLIISIGLACGSAHAGPLSKAVKAGDADAVQALLDTGFEADEAGMATPLYFAAQSGHADIVGPLLDHGADPNAMSRLGTPLNIAARRGHVEVVRLLLAAGADPNMPGGEHDHTALHNAAYSGSTEIVALLLENGADVNARGRWQEPPLHIAVDRGKDAAAEMLRQAGAAPNPVEPITRADLEAANLDNGKVLAAECTPCHTYTKGDPGERGPSLWGIVGRDKASEPDFPYSAPMKAEPGVWDYAALNQFLADVPGTIPGNGMYNGEQIDRQSRINIIAWLRTVSDDPVPLP